MFKRLKKLDDHVQSVGNRYQAYLAYVGLVVAVWLAMSGLLKWGRPFFPDAWGWPEAIVLALIALCALVLVASAALVAWRVFRPLQQKAAPAQLSTGRIATDGDVHLDLCHLLYFALEETTVALLDDLIKQVPEGNIPRNQDGDSETDASERLRKYIGCVMSAFSGTDRGMRLHAQLDHTEHNAEHELSLFLQENPQRNVDVVKLRRHFILEAQRNAIVPFLQYEREEVLRNIRLDRSKFSERYYRRSPP